MKIYGLFEYFYDYYEWGNVLYVSNNKKALENKYTEMKKNNPNVYDLVKSDTAKELCRESERCHYSINEIEYLE